MTARAIRVGVVLGGNLVEERTFADASPITIGQSLRCRLSVPADGLPHEHTLFVRDQGRLLLQLTDKMQGRIAVGSEIKTDLKGSVPIERGARGKLTCGDATILFQEMAAPTKVPRPQLPASVRGTFADRIDRRLALIVGGSIVLHIGIAAWAWMTETEMQPPLASRAVAEYRHETYAITPDEIATPSQEPGAATPVAPTQTPPPIVNRTRIETPGTPSTPKLPSAGDAERFAQILTGGNESPNGRGEMNNRMPGAELGQQIADIRDNGRTIGNDGGGFRNRQREGLGDGSRENISDGAGNIETQRPRQENGPDGRVTPWIDDGGDPLPDAEEILRKIRNAYMPGLMRCYRLGLNDEPSLRGKINLTFTVTETGKVADPKAKGLNEKVDSCVQSQMVSWRLPIQRGSDREPVEKDVSMALAMVPSN